MANGNKIIIDLNLLHHESCFIMLEFHHTVHGLKQDLLRVCLRVWFLLGGDKWSCSLGVIHWPICPFVCSQKVAKTYSTSVRFIGACLLSRMCLLYFSCCTCTLSDRYRETYSLPRRYSLPIRSRVEAMFISWYEMAFMLTWALVTNAWIWGCIGHIWPPVESLPFRYEYCTRYNLY